MLFTCAPEEDALEVDPSPLHADPAVQDGLDAAQAVVPHAGLLLHPTDRKGVKRTVLSLCREADGYVTISPAPVRAILPVDHSATSIASGAVAVRAWNSCTSNGFCDTGLSCAIDYTPWLATDIEGIWVVVVAVLLRAWNSCTDRK